MKSHINYITKYNTEVKPYGNYDNMFVFTGDSKKKI